MPAASGPYACGYRGVVSTPFGFGAPGSGDNPFDMNAFGQALQQLGQMMQSAGAPGADGPVNWTVVEDVARKAVTSAGDPSISDGQREAISSAVALAELSGQMPSPGQE